MTFFKLLIAAFVLVVAAALVTIIYVLAQTGGTKATGTDLLLAMTIHSLFYWLLLAVTLAVVWWPLQRWLF
ncbi:MAG: hypothetical protein ACHP8A_13610 [Terriglobales bacterium]